MPAAGKQPLAARQKLRSRTSGNASPCGEGVIPPQAAVAPKRRPVRQNGNTGSTQAALDHVHHADSAVVTKTATLGDTAFASGSGETANADDDGKNPTTTSLMSERDVGVEDSQALTDLERGINKMMRSLDSRTDILSEMQRNLREACGEDDNASALSGSLTQPPSPTAIAPNSLEVAEEFDTHAAQEESALSNAPVVNAVTPAEEAVRLVVSRDVSENDQFGQCADVDPNPAVVVDQPIDPSVTIGINSMTVASVDCESLPVDLCGPPAAVSSTNVVPPAAATSAVSSIAATDISSSGNSAASAVIQSALGRPVTPLPAADASAFCGGDTGGSPSAARRDLDSKSFEPAMDQETEPFSGDTEALFHKWQGEGERSGAALLGEEPQTDEDSVPSLLATRSDCGGTGALLLPESGGRSASASKDSSWESVIAAAAAAADAAAARNAAVGFRIESLLQPEATMASPPGDLGATDGGTRSGAAMNVTTAVGPKKAIPQRSSVAMLSAPAPAPRKQPVPQSVTARSPRPARSVAKAATRSTAVAAVAVKRTMKLDRGGDHSSGISIRSPVLPEADGEAASLAATIACVGENAVGCGRMAADSGGTRTPTCATSAPNSPSSPDITRHTDTPIQKPQQSVSGTNRTKKIPKSVPLPVGAFDVARRSVVARKRGETGSSPQRPASPSSNDSPTRRNAGGGGSSGTWVAGNNTLNGHPRPSISGTSKTSGYPTASTKTTPSANVSSRASARPHKSSSPPPPTSSPPIMRSAPVDAKRSPVVGRCWSPEASRRGPSTGTTNRSRNKVSSVAWETLATNLYVMEEHVRMLCEEKLEAEGGRIADLQTWGSPQNQ